MLVVRDMPDGTFAVADAPRGVRIVQDGFKSRAEAQKFIEAHRGVASGRDYEGDEAAPDDRASHRVGRNPKWQT